MNLAQIQARRILVDADYPPRQPLWYRLLIGAAIATALYVTATWLWEVAL